MFLRELKQNVTTLKGVGPAMAKSLASIGIFSISDLLLHFPRDYEDRQTPMPLARATPERPANTVITVVAHDYIGFGRKSTLKVLVEDGTTGATLVCFGRNFLSKTLVPGARFYLYGVFTYRFGELQATAFETEPFSDKPKNFGTILPIYGLGGSLNQGIMRRSVRGILAHEYKLDDELPERIVQKHGLMTKADAIKSIHFPEGTATISRARRTLIYEELFHLQLAVKRRTLKAKTKSKARSGIDKALATALIQRLPFSLTPDQEFVLEEIMGDLGRSHPMTRLLQGDVGCGKTLVAFLAALMVIGSGEAKAQVAVMAPTELLARQHAESAARLLEPLGVRVALLSGSLKSQQRKRLTAALESGEIDLVLGTHALFSKDVVYKNLGLAVVDEQHRFGVLQRLALLGRGSTPPDLLLMTATPIPRSLALTVFGDLDVSTIKTMPAGRKPVATHLAKIGNEEKVYDWVREEVRKGHQAYFVYPLIQESAALDLKDAETAFEHLRTTVFQSFRLGIIHSRLREEQKRDTMAAFVAGNIDILVATSVVEVGVNVENATCMVVEHAERFGLSALHQLRGRVGRAAHQSYAFLVYAPDTTPDAKTRLMAMKESNDGFAIAEKDLMIRGPGELTGIRQSGQFRLTIADIVRDIEQLKMARSDVEEIIKTDPGLLDPSNARLRKVLNAAPPFSQDAGAGG